MKKLMFVVVFLMLGTVCACKSSARMESIQYIPQGEYNLSGEMKVYTFENSYEVVTLNDNEDLVMIINTEHPGISFGGGIYKGFTFCGLSQNYILYKQNENIVAVSISIKEKNDLQIGEYAHEILKLEELTEDEQNTIILPSGSYIRSF